ncbi:hypothetical protein [Arthrobacter cryoconiti]|uniref:Uncharacterized protein n=1 Tax=Arthrobacter cryoconiti TaxID=748907 RepID=A0ABV8QZR1_9MICC|nr:hypothetical protein [Arthrobacter cryoconiti]MCC9068576.1 hypothetical protein [Arthrobacter cryoconiti]
MVDDRVPGLSRNTSTDRKDLVFDTLRREILAARLKVTLDEQLRRPTSSPVQRLAKMKLPPIVNPAHRVVEIAALSELQSVMAPISLKPGESIRVVPASANRRVEPHGFTGFAKSGRVKRGKDPRGKSDANDRRDGRLATPAVFPAETPQSPMMR